MDIPVYKLYLAKPNLEAMRLTPAQQQELLAVPRKNLADIGAKTLLSADIFSNEDYQWMGVEWFPNLQAVIDHSRCLAEVTWLQYLTSEVFLGTDIPGGQFPNNLEPYHPVQGAPAPIYKAWVARIRNPLQEVSAEQREKRSAVEAYVKEHGIIRHIYMLSTMQFNESWSIWGLERYPDQATLEGDTMLKWNANWWSDSRTRSYLGIANGGLLSGLE
jgi:hypothetical protein